MLSYRSISGLQILAMLVLSSLISLPSAASMRPRMTTGALGAQQDVGTLSGRFLNAPLGDVLGSLAEKENLVVRFIDPSTAEWPVSAEFTAVSLRNAIRVILKDVSYVYYERPKQNLLLVFASAATRSQTSVGMLAMAGRSEQMLTVAKKQPQISRGVDKRGQAVVKEAQEHLRTGDDATQMAAIAELAGVRGDESVAVLKDLAAGTLAASRDASVEAARTLATDALQNASSDSSQLAALQELASSPNEQVQGIARDTLEDIARLRKFEMRRRLGLVTPE